MCLCVLFILCNQDLDVNFAAWLLTDFLDSRNIHGANITAPTIVCFVQAFRFGEYFAGCGNVTFAMQLNGFASFKMDRDYGGDFNDFLTTSGFARLLSKQVLRTEYGLVYI